MDRSDGPSRVDGDVDLTVEEFDDTRDDVLDIGVGLSRSGGRSVLAKDPCGRLIASSLTRRLFAGLRRGTGWVMVRCLRSPSGFPRQAFTPCRYDVSANEMINKLSVIKLFYSDIYLSDSPEIFTRLDFDLVTIDLIELFSRSRECVDRFVDKTVRLIPASSISRLRRLEQLELIILE